MDSLCSKLEDTCSTEMLADLGEGVRTATDDLQCLQLKCHQIIERLQNFHASIGTESYKQMSADDADNHRFVVIASSLAEKCRCSVYFHMSVSYMNSPLFIPFIKSND